MFFKDVIVEVCEGFDKFCKLLEDFELCASIIEEDLLYIRSLLIGEKMSFVYSSIW